MSAPIGLTFVEIFAPTEKKAASPLGAAGAASPTSAAGGRGGAAAALDLGAFKMRTKKGGKTPAGSAGGGHTSMLFQSKGLDVSAAAAAATAKMAADAKAAKKAAAARAAAMASAPVAVQKRALPSFMTGGSSKSVATAAAATKAAAAAMMASSRGTLLYFALEKKVPVAVTLAILAAWPEAAQEKNDGGHTSLSLALKKNAPLAVTQAVLAAWPGATKEQCAGWGGSTERNLPMLYHAVETKAPEPVVLAVLAAWPEAAKEKSYNNNTLLERALAKKASVAVTLAVLNAWPGAVKEKPTYYSTDSHIPLQIVLKKEKKIPEPVTLAVLAAWPNAAKEKDSRGNTKLHFALENDAQEAVTLAVLAAWPDAAKEKNNSGDTPLHLALEMGTLGAVTLAVIAAWPDAVSEKDIHGNTPLHIALKYSAPYAVSLAIVAAWPGAIKEQSALLPGNMGHANPYARWRGPATAATGRDTPLHMLAISECSTVLKQHQSCALCYRLVAKGASLSDINTEKKTPLMAIQMQLVAKCWYCGCRCLDSRHGQPQYQQQGNHHLLAAMKEINMFKMPKHRHLGMEHFRDWTTVTHAWCAPSAKLTAVTVLLVGCSFKRLAAQHQLPRLPMDCWYRILNCIPRHELRLGKCTPSKEEAALVKYKAILAVAKGT